MNRYVFYNPNPLQRFHKDGTPMKWKHCDCTVRAICKAENTDWESAYKLLFEIGLEHYMMPCDPELLNIAFAGMGYLRHTFKNTERIPLKKFAETHKQGTFIASMPGHVVAVVNGKYYDAFDSGDFYITSYWKQYWDSESEFHAPKYSVKKKS